MWNPREAANVAKSWIGRNFHPGQIEQCMAFVRECLNESKSPVAKLVTKEAVDGLDTGYYLASSLAGRDLGYELHDELARLSVGSVVFFADTYGNWPKGTITHVGIYIGSGQFVHRPTSERNVELARLDSGYWYDRFRCALDLGRPTGGNVVSETPKDERLRQLKIFAHSGKIRVFSDGKEVDATEIKIFVNGGKLGVSVNGASIEPSGLELDLRYMPKKKT